MKTERNILCVFILNLFFSIFEFVGGMLTGSVAIISDAVHDVGDAVSIGFSLFFEKKSKKAPDEIYTYGYRRYSVLGGIITTLVLLLGSVAVIFNAIRKIISPTQINYDGMLILAVIGVIINLGAAYLTHDKSSVNQRAVNLHMLEDALGWIVVLAGAVIMRFTDLTVIDPIMTIGISLFIIVNTVKNLKEIMDLFLEKTPKGLSVSKIKEEILKIDGVKDVYHIHIWSIDGQINCATMHVVFSGEPMNIKETIRTTLKANNIVHSTIETDENCSTKSKHCYLAHHIHNHAEHCHHKHNH